MDWTNIGLTPALTDTNFIVKEQCLCIRYSLGRMFCIDGAKQDEQNGVDQPWIGPTLERPDGDGNGEQIDAEQSFAMEFGNFSSDKLWIGQTLDWTKLRLGMDQENKTDVYENKHLYSSLYLGSKKIKQVPPDEQSIAHVIQSKILEKVMDHEKKN